MPFNRISVLAYIADPVLLIVATLITILLRSLKKPSVEVAYL